MRTGTTSRYRGVIWVKKTQCWRARITSGGRLRRLGLFADDRGAARTYDKMAKKLFGERAMVNFAAAGVSE